MSSSRRRFLQLAGSSAIAMGSGCSGDGGGVLGLYDWKVAWPPQEPYTKPDLADLPDLSSPTLGDSSTYYVEVYHDLMTEQAGEFFQEGIDFLEEPLENGTLSLIYRDLPLPWSDWSYPVAIAARSVQHNAGMSAFWDFCRRVLQEYSPEPYYYMDRETVLSAAEEVGAPPEKVRDDTESWKFYEIVQQDLDRAKRLGIDGGVPYTVIHRGEKQIIGHGSAGRILWLIEEDFENSSQTQQNQT